MPSFVLPSSARRYGRRERSAFAPTLALLLAVASCQDGDAAAGAARMPAFRVPVTWAVAQSGEVVERVELVGDVVSRYAADLAFEREGRVVEVSADLGDVVAQGAPLAKLDDAVLAQELAVARAQVAAAAAQATFARNEAQRGREAGEHVLSASDRDRRDTTAQAAEAALAEREAQVARLAELLAQGRLDAPFDGVVSARWISPGSYANRGQRAFAVTDLAHREVHLEMPASVATRVVVGGAVELTADELPGQVVRARLDELVPAAEAATRTFTAVARLDGLDAERTLLPGMFVRARFDTRRASGQAVVPADSVVMDAKGSRIARLQPPDPSSVAGEDGLPPAPKAELLPVRVLARDGASAAVESLLPDSPLRPGDIVLVTGADNVWPGADLMPRPPLDGDGQ